MRDSKKRLEALEMHHRLNPAHGHMTLDDYYDLPEDLYNFCFGYYYSDEFERPKGYLHEIPEVNEWLKKKRG